MFDKTITLSSSDGSVRLIFTSGRDGPKTIMLRTATTLQVVTPEEAMDWLQKGLPTKPLVQGEADPPTP